MRALVTAITVGSTAVAGALGGCEDRERDIEDDDGNVGGAGGCPMRAEPNFTISVSIPDGPVPADIVVQIAWSAGEEPAFALNDPTSWKTLDVANILCAVDYAKPPPADLPALVCQLWTTGATRVEISAAGFMTYERTLTPTMSELCEGVVPQEVDIVLAADEGR